MPSKSVSEDKRFRADGEGKSEKFKITNNHHHEIYISNCVQRIREKESDGEEEMKFAIKQMESENTSDCTIGNHNLSCPSKQIRGSCHEAGKSKVKDNCSTIQSDLRDVETVSVPLPNIGVVNVYQCKYCSEESKDKESLIVPCRCSGSLKYVHQNCLKNWIRFRSEGSSETEPRCELCRYRFYHQKQYKWTKCSCPELSRSDCWLYSIGSICVLIVICCLLALILCFGQDNPFTKNYADYRADERVTLSVTTNEINRAIGTYGLRTLDNIKIVCGVSFIIFSALCVFLVKSCKTPLHKFIFRYIQSNEQWTILHYSVSRDSLVMENATNV